MILQALLAHLGEGEEVVEVHLDSQWVTEGASRELVHPRGAEGALGAALQLQAMQQSYQQFAGHPLMEPDNSTRGIRATGTLLFLHAKL